MSVMVRARLRVRVDLYRPRPKFLCAHAGEIYRRGAIHSGSLVCASHGLEGIGGDDAHAGGFPVGFGI